MGTQAFHTQTTNPFLLSIEGNAKWSGTVSFNFVQTGTTELTNYNNILANFPQPVPPMTTNLIAVYETEFAQALTSFMEIANLNLVINNDGNADYLVGEDQSGSLGFATGPFNAQGVIAFNPAQGSAINTAETGGGNDRVQTIIHEIGHALGLQHPHGLDSGTTAPSTNEFAMPLPYQQQYTMMSYTTPPNTNVTFNGDQAGAVNNGRSVNAMALDIAALQNMYGANMNTRTGNSTYTLTDARTAALDLTGETISVGRAYYGIWDAGTNDIDTIQYSGNDRVLINLMAATLTNTPAAEITDLVNTLQAQTAFGTLSAATQTEITSADATAGGFLSSIISTNGDGALLAAGDRVQGGYSIANGVVIENATGGSGADILVGNAAANTITGNAGDDLILGGNGNDTLDGGVGADTLLGGAGDDVYLYDSGDERNVITDSGGQDRLLFGAGLTVDNLILVVSGSDILGSFLGQGNDVITMTNAVTTPSARTDLLQFSDGNVLDLGGIIGGNIFDDTVNNITGTNDSTFVNTAGGNDVIDAQGGNDIVVAGAGNDTITGGTGIDQLYGGLGDDVYLYSAGDGLDRIVDIGGRDEMRFSGGINPDDLILVVRNADILGSFFGAGSDVFEMINAVTTPSARTDILRFNDGTVLDLGGIVGGQNFDDNRNEINGRNDSDFTNARGGNDAILGNGGNDIIFGGAGNDDIDGGFGLDVLRGGSDSDKFIFSVAPNANDADLILDFQTGTDQILLSSAQFGLAQGALAAGSFVQAAAAQDANDRLIYNAGNQQLLFDADGTGGAAAIKIAELNGGVALAESDFLVF